MVVIHFCDAFVSRFQDCPSTEVMGVTTLGAGKDGGPEEMNGENRTSLDILLMCCNFHPEYFC